MPKLYWADSQGQLYKISEELSHAYFKAKERVSELSNGLGRTWYARTLMAIGGAISAAGAKVSKASDHLLAASIVGSGAFVSSIGTSFENKKNRLITEAQADVDGIEKRVAMSVANIMPNTRIDTAVLDEVHIDDKILTAVQQTQVAFTASPHEKRHQIVAQTAIVETSVQNVRERAFAAYHQAMRAGTSTIL